MPKSVAHLTQEYQSPKLMHRFPVLIRLQHLTAWMLTARLWIVRKVARRILRQLPDASRVIDFGCGAGELIFPLSGRFPNLQFTGCDLSREAIKTARFYQLIRSRPQVDFQQADLMEWPGRERYDLILTISVLQYIPDPERAIQKIRSLMKPGATWLIYLPVNDQRVLPGYRRLRETWLKPVVYDSSRHLNGLNDSELEQLLEKFGLKIRQKYYVYGQAGRISYELISFGQLLFLRLPWVAAVLHALVYFPIVLLPAWLLMAWDLAAVRRSGNGMLAEVTRV